MVEPKILIGAPTYVGKKYCLKQYLEGVKNLNYSNYELVLVDNSETDDYAKYIKATINEMGIKGKVIKDVWINKTKERLVHSRNILRDIFLKEGFDYFFSLEQDTVMEPDDLKKMIAHGESGKKVVSGIVLNYYDVGKEKRIAGKLLKGGKRIIVPMAWVPMEAGKVRYMKKEELESGKVFEVWACSLSATLIHKEVLEKIKFRYEKAFDDMAFCRDAKQKGFKVYVDTTIRPFHLKTKSELKVVRL
ncbi:MAG: glycosyltransferase [Candidatus Woesearchaeota archaeon]